MQLRPEVISPSPATASTATKAPGSLSGWTIAGRRSAAGPSYPINPWEYPVSRTDRNYSYFILVTRELLGKSCEVVVLGFDPKNLEFKPDVWLTAHPIRQGP